MGTLDIVDAIDYSELKIKRHDNLLIGKPELILRNFKIGFNNFIRTV